LNLQILNTILHKAPWLTATAILIVLWRIAWASVKGTRRLVGRRRLETGEGNGPPEPVKRGAGLHSEARSSTPASFIRRRASTENFSGLPLTLIATAFIFGLFLAGNLLSGLHGRGALQSFDEMVNRLIDPLRTKEAVLFFTGLTIFGGTWTLSILTPAASALLWFLKKREHILPLWLTFLGTMSTTFLGKGIIDRARPDFMAGITACSPSFPSGHTAGAMAVYGFLAYLAARELSGTRARFEAVYWSATLVFLIGFSRVFLSVHFFSDVLAGWLVGFLWILAGVAADQWARREKGLSS